MPALSACGTIFKISPSGSFTTLASLDGVGPFSSGLVAATDGNVYGTATTDDCALTCGSIFKISSAGTVTTIASFTPTNGVNNLDFQGAYGNFYGIALGELSLIRMTPGGVVTTLYTFCTQGSFCAEGEHPRFLIQGADGDIYGTTTYGGANLLGAIYRLSLPMTDLPSIAATNGVVNGASFQPGIVPGSWMTVKGSNLATMTDGWNPAPGGALPTMLDGVSLMIGGQPAFIAYISPTQIKRRRSKRAFLELLQ